MVFVYSHYFSEVRKDTLHAIQQPESFAATRELPCICLLSTHSTTFLHVFDWSCLSPVFFRFFGFFLSLTREARPSKPTRGEAYELLTRDNEVALH